jgi:peptidoglycan/LPS O-acetylase OafA/YrhL
MDFVIVALSIVAAYMVYHWLEVPADDRRNSERRWR